MYLFLNTAALKATDFKNIFRRGGKWPERANITFLWLMDNRVNPGRGFLWDNGQLKLFLRGHL